MEVATGRYWAIDVEGNGSSPPEIVELGLVELAGLRLTGVTHRWLVKPRLSISSMASKIHGIRDADVVDAPLLDQVGPEILAILGATPVLGHNVRVDVDAVSRGIRPWVARDAVDTLKLARFLRPSLEAYSLESVASALGCSSTADTSTNRRLHSAVYDATLAALIFIELMRGLDPARRSIALQHANLFDDRQGSLL